MFSKIGLFLDSITMYRLVLYGLLTELFYSLILGLLGKLPYSATELATSAGILILFCILANMVISRLVRVAANPESSAITALILYLVLSPLNLTTLVLASVIAMASKYFLTINKKHLFNPSALALFVLGSGSAAWWVGLLPMLPVVLSVGLLIVAKLRRFHMFFGFLVAAILLNLISFTFLNVNPLIMMTQMFATWPVIFFGTVMLTEPLTTPPTRSAQTLYGAIVGILYGTSVSTFSWYWPPEFKLLLANLLSFWVSFRFRIFPELIKRTQLVPGIYEFSFSKDPRLVFKPGQFMEWTFVHDNQDDRGARRYFTIASSPTEKDLKICIRLNREKSSSFKNGLLNLRKGDRLTASGLQGDFVLPTDKTNKLVFIAGGIGITPFRSMVKYLEDSNEERSIILFYVNKSADDIVYRDVFMKKSGLDLKVVNVLTDLESVPENWGGKTGRVDERMIREEVPDYIDRTYYLSGPSGMVDSYKEILKKMGVGSRRIVTDYFPGY